MLSRWSCSQWAWKKFVWAGALICCCLQATQADDPSTVLKSQADDILQTDMDVPKRDWNKNLNMWGKRGWNNIHGGWGLKRSTPYWEDSANYPPIQEDKKAWSNLQGGWGKRYAPSEEEMSVLAALLDDNSVDGDLDYDRPDYHPHDYEKRNWNKFRDGWGKRDRWEKFRGSWGKREPAWSNLRGVWGK